MPVKLDVTDQPINYRPGSNGLNPTWGLSVNGKRIGTVWETEDGYAGQIEGTTGTGQRREYICPEVAFRQTVIERLEEMTDRLAIG